MNPNNPHLPSIHTKQLENGLTVIVEEMDHVESASYDLLIPGGLISDSDETVGSSVILAELLGRGAGPYSSRELSEKFDSLGARRGEGAGLDKFALSGNVVADVLPAALQLTAYMVTEPHLVADEIPNIQSVLLQDLASVRDNPARRAGVELHTRYYPAPYNRSTLGSEGGVTASSHTSISDLYKRFFRPNKAILSVAGKVKAEEVFALASNAFQSWKGESELTPPFSTISPLSYHHIEVDSSQMQILIAAPSACFGAKEYYAGKLAVSVLGASMFGRLFVEVREKRGLCYSVYARHASNTAYGTFTAYVGTTPERAQESLDVLTGELTRLRASVTQDELERARMNLKASLVIGEESPGSRAGSNATDWWLLGRVRGLQEISLEIDKVDLGAVDTFLERYPFSPATILTLGKGSLKLPPAFSHSN